MFCRGYLCYFKNEFVTATEPNRFLSDGIVRLELLRGLPEDWTVTEVRGVGWLLEKESLKVLLVDIYLMENESQMRNAFEAMWQADIAMVVSHEEGHFVAAFIVHPNEAQKEAKDRKFQPLVVVADSLASSSKSVNTSHASRLLDGLQASFSVDIKANFAIYNLPGSTQKGGTDCGIFSWMTLHKFLDQPDFFDVQPGEVLKEETKQNLTGWIARNVARATRQRLHREYQKFWEDKCRVIWSASPIEDLRKIIAQGPSWLVRAVLNQQPKTTNFQASVGRISASELANFLEPGTEVSDGMMRIAVRDHPTFPGAIVSSVICEEGDYVARAAATLYGGQQLVDDFSAFRVTTGYQSIVEEITKKTQVLFIPVFRAEGHYWSIWLDLQGQKVYFCDSLNDTNEQSAEKTATVNGMMTELNRFAQPRLEGLLSWPIKEVFSSQISSECFICVVEMFRLLTPDSLEPIVCSPRRPRWDRELRLTLLRELFPLPGH